MGQRGGKVRRWEGSVRQGQLGECLDPMFWSSIRFPWPLHTSRRVRVQDLPTLIHGWATGHAQINNYVSRFCLSTLLNLIFPGWMMEYFSEGSTMTSREAYGYASGVVLCSAAYTFFHHPYTFGLQHVGMKMRVASSALLYR